MRKFSLFLVLVLIAVLFTAAQAQDETFTLTLIHTNDTHAAHEPNSNGDGGAARLASVVNQVRASADNVLLVDAGDRFTGTLFHTQFLGADQVQIMNALGYNVMTLGNHEFDNGDEVLGQFLDGISFPAVVANIDVANSAPLAGKLVNSTVIDVNGQQIGFVGLITADTAFSSSPSDAVVFNADYAAAANAAAAELVAQGVNKIILLTHTGIMADETFVGALENIDAVIGGHSHTLFSNTYAAASGEYPLAFETPAGTTVYYGQAGANGLYVGVMELEFDAEGNVVNAGGDTVFLSRFITPDAEVEALVTTLAAEIEELRNTPINATTETLLVGDRAVCRTEECNLGNLIADAMRAETDAQIAFMNGGGVRANIEPGDITLGEVLTVHPFGNIISTFSIKGADVIAALENGVSGLRVENGVLLRDGNPGRFLQVSGLRYSFDPNLEVGSRITKVEVLNEAGEYVAIDPEAVYSAVTLNFLRTGGDGFTVFAENAIDPYDFGRVDYEATAAFLAANSPINYAVEGRITIENATVAPLE